MQTIYLSRSISIRNFYSDQYVYIQIDLKVIKINQMQIAKANQSQSFHQENQKNTLNKDPNALIKSTYPPKNQQKQPQNQSSNQLGSGFPSTNMIRGGLIGVAISALVSWNTGRYSRIGSAFRRLRFTRNFILTNQKPTMTLFTNYYTPNLSTVMNNFMCFSGEAGIGKSYHFQDMAYRNSGVRPAIYLAFKAAGKDTTFEQDLASQVDYGKDCPGMLSEIIKAVKKIDSINKNPMKLWFQIASTHLLFLGATYGVYISSLEATYGIVLFSLLGAAYTKYIHFMAPFAIQSFRRTCPLIIFDDLNKIQHMNMLPQIVRYLQLLENDMANVILVSSDEETWSKLRRQPGVKDRLRLRQISYDHIYTAQKILQFINDDKDYQFFMKFINGNSLYNKKIVISLIKQLIGKRQVTLRRFISILKLNDQEEYEKLVQVLTECSKGTISNGQAVQKFTDILYESQMETMVSNLKNIKRQSKVGEEDFFRQLKLLLKKGKLPSDNQIAPHLKAYNIVRDLRSQYVFNGKFMYTVFNMAIKQYEEDMKQFREVTQKIKDSSSDKKVEKSGQNIEQIKVKKENKEGP